MKMYARTTRGSYLNDFKGEDWSIVKTCYNYYPSGRRECVRFPDGFECKVEYCEVVYFFEK